MNVFSLPDDVRMGAIHAVPATPALLRAFYGDGPRPTLRGYVFMKDGEPIGVAGLKSEQGMQVLFSDTKPDATISAMEKWRCAKMVMAACRTLTKPVFAMVELGDFRSQKWIRSLGFGLVRATAQGELYAWPC